MLYFQASNLYYLIALTEFTVFMYFYNYGYTNVYQNDIIMTNGTKTPIVHKLCENPMYSIYIYFIVLLLYIYNRFK